MIYGIGIDTATVARLARSIARPGFEERCFSAGERGELDAGGERARAQSAAARFAAKEAFGKAMGTGIAPSMLGEVALLHEEGGRPYLAFTGETARRIKAMGLDAHVSVTHEGGFATCIVVLEK